MRLIQSLARQLGGQLTVSGDDGTRVALSWRAAAVEEPAAAVTAA
jgi:two-component sensor histidine kinase